MKIIGWDTSSKSGVIVALESQEHERKNSSWKLVCQWQLNLTMTHSERLLWAIDFVLKACEWELSHVDAFAVGVGPGSFTGLRIGVTTARTLGEALQKKVIPVSSLEALVIPWKKKGLIPLAGVDACKGEIYALFPKKNEKVMTHEVFKAEIKKLLKSNKKSKILALGDIWSRIPEFEKIIEKRASDDMFERVTKTSVSPIGLALAIQKVVRSGRDGVNPQEVVPRYLRASDAELKLKSGQLNVPLAFSDSKGIL